MPDVAEKTPQHNTMKVTTVMLGPSHTKTNMHTSGELGHALPYDCQSQRVSDNLPSA
jgi:hypothetical protein